MQRDREPDAADLVEVLVGREEASAEGWVDFAGDELRGHCGSVSDHRHLPRQPATAEREVGRLRAAARLLDLGLRLPVVRNVGPRILPVSKINATAGVELKRELRFHFGGL